MTALTAKLLALADRIEELAHNRRLAGERQAANALDAVTAAIRMEFGVVSTVVEIDCGPKKRKARKGTSR